MQRGGIDFTAFFFFLYVYYVPQISASTSLPNVCTHHILSRILTIIKAYRQRKEEGIAVPKTLKGKTENIHNQLRNVVKSM